MSLTTKSLSGQAFCDGKEIKDMEIPSDVTKLLLTKLLHIFATNLQVNHEPPIYLRNAVSGNSFTDRENGLIMIICVNE